MSALISRRQFVAAASTAIAAPMLPAFASASPRPIPTLPAGLDWPTWGESEEETLPAEVYWVAGGPIPADALAERLAELGPGSWLIDAGRLDPEDGCIALRELGWITVRPDGNVDLEPND